MRRFKYKKIQKNIINLKENHKILISLSKDCRQEELINLLQLCQELAIEVGNIIEESESDSGDLIHLLEEYCETVYQVSVNFGDENDLLKKLEVLIHEINFSIEKNIIVEKKIIVFLPFKAAMWDSLESIWLAAKDENDCECYIVPAPYFNKNPDGSLGELQYEGNEFPDFVKVTDWEKFDLEKVHPDVIFIHNPYDNFNKVTSIHPDFYTKKLKSYTELLVYIPYFVARNDVPKQYCVLPGTMYSDKVFLQSEKVRETYINEFNEILKDTNLRSYLENKFVAIGSPKEDRVLSYNLEESKIPEAWKKLIDTGRKIVFYNTHVNGLMKGNADKFIPKLKNVLSIFKSTKNVVLLWRPHPLSISTIESMNPDLMKKYMDIVDEFNESGWGIYDDSSDLNRAIALSDAYYGDFSSVVKLFKELGKPILIQDFNIIYGEDKN